MRSLELAAGQRVLNVGLETGKEQAALLANWLGEFRLVLRPGGRLVIASLTEGVDRPSRVFVKMWKLAYALSPLTCGGCRPLQLSKLVRQVGFEQVESQVVVQPGIPSEVIAAESC